MSAIDPGQIRTRQDLTAQLRLLFDSKGSGMHKVASEAHLSSSTVQALLSGVTGLPRAGTLESFVKALGQDTGPWLAARARVVSAERTAGAASSGREAGRTAEPPLGRVIRELSESDALRLEVHQAFEAAESGTGSSPMPVLTSYLPRAGFDDRLREAVAAAEHGSRLVMVVGGSSTGKTRACWEAIRAMLPGWRVWHPLTPERPQAVVETLVGNRLAARTVIWLNEAQFYLQPAPAGKRVATALQALLADRAEGPFLVLGSMWPEYWRLLTQDPGTDEGSTDSHGTARALLDQAHEFTAPALFTAEQLAELNPIVEADPRLLAAVRQAAGGRIAQELAGAPVLLRRYQRAGPVEQAVLHAAMDGRRLVDDALYLPEPFLKAAAVDYLNPDDWDRHRHGDWFGTALKKLTEPSRGLPGPLIERQPRPGEEDLPHPLYRLSDYLDQTGRAERVLICPPDSFWDAADRAHLGDRVELGDAAHGRGLFRRAAQIYKNAIVEGHPGAGVRLGKLLRSHPGVWQETDQEDWAAWVAERAPLQDSREVAKLIELLWKIGGDGAPLAALLRRNLAVQVLLRDLDENSSLYKCELSELLDKLHELDRRAREKGARALADLAAGQKAALADRIANDLPLDDYSRTPSLIWTLRDIEARPQMKIFLWRSFEHESIEYAFEVDWWLETLEDFGAGKQEIAARKPDLLKRAARDLLLNAREVAELLPILRKAKAYEAAKILLERDPAHAFFLSQMDPDDPDDREDSDKGWTFLNLEWLLKELGKISSRARKAGAHEVADLAARQKAALVAQFAARLTPENAQELARGLEILHDVKEPLHLRRLLDGDPAARVRLDNWDGVAYLLETLTQVDATEQVSVLADRVTHTEHLAAAEPPDISVAARLLTTLRMAGAETQAAGLLAWAVEHAVLDSPGGVAKMLDLLAEHGTAEQVSRLVDRAATDLPLSSFSHDIPPSPEDENRRRMWEERSELSILFGALHRGTSKDGTPPLDQPTPPHGSAGPSTTLAAHDSPWDRFIERVSIKNPRAVAAMYFALVIAGNDGAWGGAPLVPRKRAQAGIEALLARNPAQEVELGDPGGVAALLWVLQRDLRPESARQQWRALLERDPAGSVILGDWRGAAQLVNLLADADEQGQGRAAVINLAERISRSLRDFDLRDAFGMADLLRALHRAGLGEQAIALAQRLVDAGLPVESYYRVDVDHLLKTLRDVRATAQVAALKEPLTAAGHYRSFADISGES